MSRAFMEEVIFGKNKTGIPRKDIALPIGFEVLQAQYFNISPPLPKRWMVLSEMQYIQ